MISVCQLYLNAQSCWKCKEAKNIQFSTSRKKSRLLINGYTIWTIPLANPEHIQAAEIDWQELLILSTTLSHGASPMIWSSSLNRLRSFPTSLTILRTKHTGLLTTVDNRIHFTFKVVIKVMCLVRWVQINYK